MPTDYSFDVVSRVDVQELDNALNQTRKEIEGRFDFKNSKTTVEKTEQQITIVTDDELKLKNVTDMLQSKLIKRGISIKALEFGKIEPAAGNAVRQFVTIKSGIPKDKSKPLIEAIKAAKLKVQTQFQDEQLRVSSKSKDDLQKVQALLSSLDGDVPLQFVNRR
ncbi:MAG: YajQ family cyclic di-GMP-binding protein [Candidatus Eremiobacteraeota bacterium]|nr:YajQ family cyclic di-GMP-binding protein [Candidatus Eremiobacteraeota bacterium]